MSHSEKWLKAPGDRYRQVFQQVGYRRKQSKGTAAEKVCVVKRGSWFVCLFVF